MPSIVGPHATIATHAQPLDGHVAHLRHLAKHSTAALILRKRFNRSTAQSNKEARDVASHVDRALDFHSASVTATDRIRPLLQYYAYLNLAVAVILAYRPKNHLAYRNHGVRDLTANLTKLELSSRVVSVSRGAITLFHDVLSDAPLPQQPLRLKSILAAIPMLSAELKDAFNVIPAVLLVSENVHTEGNSPQLIHYSQVSFRLGTESGTSRQRISRSAIEHAMPILGQAYRQIGTSDGRYIHYRSRQTWSNAERADASNTHRRNMFKIINFGGHRVTDNSAGYPETYMWCYLPRCLMLPTASAALLFSFFLSSLARYRPLLSEHLENSRLNILRDSFINEADGFLIPMFRNLLYREELAIAAAEMI